MTDQQDVINQLFDALVEESVSSVDIETFTEAITVVCGAEVGKGARSVFGNVKADNFGTLVVSREQFKYHINMANLGLQKIYQWLFAVQLMHAAKDLFNALDINGSGTIDRDELFRFEVDCRGVEKKVASKIVEALFAAQDDNKNGQIDWRAYARHVVQDGCTIYSLKTLRKWQTRAFLVQAARRLFHALDTNVDGELEPSELIAYIKESSGEDIDEAKAEQLMISMDGNLDGIVDWPEFLKWVTINKAPPEYINKMAANVKYAREGISGYAGNALLAGLVVAAVAAVTVVVVKFAAQKKT